MVVQMRSLLLGIHWILILTLEEMLKAAKQTLRGEKGIMIKEVEL